MSVLPVPRLPVASLENDSRAISPARTPDPGAREGRRAGEVEPGDDGLVPGQLRVGVTQRGERSAAEARGMADRQVEPSLVVLRGDGPPLDDGVEEPRLTTGG